MSSNSIASITDGTSNTIAFAESANSLLKPTGLQRSGYGDLVLRRVQRR